MAEPLSGPGWSTRLEGRRMVLRLSGEWRTRQTVARAREAALQVARSDIDAITFESDSLGQWDSSLLVFLSALQEEARRRRILFDHTGLPVPACRLLNLLPQEPSVPDVALRPVGRTKWLRQWLAGRWSDSVAITTLVGEATLRTVPAVRGKAGMRAVDLMNCIRDAGVAALPMVALVNALVGGIIAFVGTVQLRTLGAAIYVSNLIGVTEVREMAPLITAIVMSGRTGSAYAAEIAAMQGTEETDALRALGVPLFDYLVLPRVAALTTMMPLLCLYAGACGISGGFAVAVGLMHLSVGGFMTQLRNAVSAGDIALGLAKSVAFGSWIAMASCRIGLDAGRSATDVGRAATAAAVNGIVGAIALDALFDVCANALGI
jgi:phospholipid/cholesterol/gamma-HCH transport system permease protein